MKRILMASTLLMFLAGFTWTQMASNECGGFLPANDFQIPIGFVDTGLSEKEFNAVLDKYEAVYRPIFTAHGGKLQLNRKWTDPTVNAMASRLWGPWQVDMYGGLARFPGMTADGMMMVVCHETGHHLGGGPKKGIFGWSWATNEGGADYFSALKCMRKVFAAEDNEGVVLRLNIEPLIQQKCLASFSNKNSAAICMRSAHAGLVLAKILGEIRANKIEPKIETPDISVVAVTFDEHPAAQCRLDTYYQAALCPVSADADLDEVDYHVNSCTHPTYQEGLRANCWFKPDASDMPQHRLASSQN